MIYTDSKSSLQLLSRAFPKNPIATEIQKQIFDSNKSVHICWVPSHVGILGNEHADRLANNATKAQIQIENLLTKDEMKSKIKRIGRKAWLQRWRSPLGRPNKLKEITDDLSPLPNSSCSNRRWERTLARLRLGHSRLTHGFIISNTTPPFCENCGEDTALTIKHIIVECPQYRMERLRNFGSTTVSLRSALKTGDTGFGGSLYKYLNAINIYELL